MVFDGQLPKAMPGPVRVGLAILCGPACLARGADGETMSLECMCERPAVR